MTPKAYFALGLGAIFAILIGALLWLRADLATAKAEVKTQKAEVSRLVEVNNTNAATIESYRVARLANDKLTEELTKEIARLNARGVAIRNDVKEAIRNDPQASDWANAAVPDSLRDAANRR